MILKSRDKTYAASALSATSRMSPSTVGMTHDSPPPAVPVMLFPPSEPRCPTCGAVALDRKQADIEAYDSELLALGTDVVNTRRLTHVAMRSPPTQTLATCEATAR